MTRFKLIVFSITSSLFLYSCSEILEPVSLFKGKQNIATISTQEDFDIKIKGLTFETAKKANNAPFARQVMLTGSGSSANVFDEADFLNSSSPKSSNNLNYKLGVGDKLSFIHVPAFETRAAQWPDKNIKSSYVLGAGDELTFVQSLDNSLSVAGNFNPDGQFISKALNDQLIVTKGVVGSNGNVLLFGLGNITAVNRTLDDLRTEVRNILIRNGLAPNFQLEISNFQSKKAYITIHGSDTLGESIALNNLPISLKEVALGVGLSETNKNLSLIILTRSKQNYRFTAEQLFAVNAPEIFIEDKDQIEIQSVQFMANTVQTVVGSKGNIILGDVGSIPALNRTIDDIHNQIASILIADGLQPIFQLELIDAVSKKAYLIQKNKESTLIPLNNVKITLRELLLMTKSSLITTEGLTIITLKRNGKVFRMTGENILDPYTPDILVLNDDHIEVEILAYKPGKVFALSGAGKAIIVPIDPSKRETLADVLFAKEGALNNLLAKRSEVYLLRNLNPSVAYHLDAQNVSRILVADTLQLRPNDIIYVADRPIISFSRTLAEINPLRTLLRDLEEGNL
jgi:polysaccharide biosynthesis/export protein